MSFVSLSFRLSQRAKAATKTLLRHSPSLRNLSYSLPRAADPRDLTLQSLSGDIAKDGLHRYELDLLETVEWTKEMLCKMRDNTAALKAMQVPFTPPSHTETPLCIEYSESFDYDYSRPPPANTKVTASFRVSHLGLSPEARHKLLLLASTYYDPYLDVIKISRETTPEEATEASLDRARNKKTILSVISSLIKEAKATEGESFQELPVPLTHIAPKQIHLDFPQAWIDQAAAKRNGGKSSIPGSVKSYRYNSDRNLQKSAM